MTFEINDARIMRVPEVLEAILHDTETLGFTMGSEPKTGSLLRTLASSKPASHFLELGTGTGIGTAWLLDGMDHKSRLESVDHDSKVLSIAQRHLAGDPRVAFHLMDGGSFLAKQSGQIFDLIYADAWAGKFFDLDLALSLLPVGGIYFIDDLLPQPNWPEGHESKVLNLIKDLENRPGFVATKLKWASGLMIVVRTVAP